MPETKEFQHQKYYFFAQHGKQVKLFHHYVTEVPQRGDTFDTLESSHHTEWTIIKIPSRHQAKSLMQFGSFQKEDSQTG